MKLCPIHKNRQLSPSGYCQDCGSYPLKDKKMKCKNCGHNLFYDVDTGYLLHETVIDSSGDFDDDKDIRDGWCWCGCKKPICPDKRISGERLAGEQK